jgi:hypothetical protein
MMSSLLSSAGRRWSPGTNPAVHAELRFYAPRIQTRGKYTAMINIPKQAASAQGKLTEIHDAARKQATKTAQEVYASKLIRNSHPPERQGRVTTMGGLTQQIQYIFLPNAGIIRLHASLLNEATANAYQGGTAFYWRAQEIGTGKRATVMGHRRVGDLPAKGGIYPGLFKADAVGQWNFTSQRGRGISAKLAWSTDGKMSVPPEPGGRDPSQNLWFVADHAAYRASSKGMSEKVRNRVESGLVIKREIHGKHFVRSGTIAGYRSLRGRTVAEVRRVL